MGNTFGQLFRVTTWGESHGPAIGAVVDGCPPLLELSEADIQPDLDRRAPGQSALVTQRKESDTVRILSGVFEGKTLGTPISLEIPNEDMRPGDYREIEEKYRPSHADYTYDAKYGIRDWRGGGRTSARETAGRVAAGAIARKLLAVRYGIEIVAWVSKVGQITAECDVETVSREAVEQTPIRCPDATIAAEMISAVEAARKAGNSLGGVVTCAARGCPPGWGEPVFDRLEADLAKAMLSLPASKGFEIGSGFAGTDLTGLEHNDEFYMDGGRVRTRTNNSGGVQGGISNGETVYFRVAFKPTATIMRKQRTVTRRHEETTLQGRGRHDPCVLPRAVPMVEAMAALVLADHALRYDAIRPGRTEGGREMKRRKRWQVVDVSGILWSPLEECARIQGTGIEPWLVAMTYETAEGDWQAVRESFDWLTEEQLRAAMAFAEANPEFVRERIDREKNLDLEAFWRTHPQSRPRHPSDEAAR